MPPDAQKTAEAALRHLDQLQSAVNRVGEVAEAGTIAGLVAHEIRNLLTPAIAYSQLALRAGNDPAPLRQALERSLTAMRRACEVSELILTELRSEAESTDPTRPATRVFDVVNDCVSTLGWDTPRSDFQLVVDVPSDVKVAISPEALRHVILNLLLNARSSLPASGGKITIGIASHTGGDGSHGSTWSREGRVVSIQIADNGRGIEPIKLQKIRAGLAKRPEQPVGQSPRIGLRSRHAGLGLVLCDRLLAASGAELHIESQENNGTTATVELRLAA